MIQQTQDRTGRQEKAENLYYDQLRTGKKGGTFVACTGFGKTRVAMNIMKKYRKKHPLREIIVVVPSNQILSQWETLARENGIGLVSVKTIQSISLQENNYVCGFLIIDEVHWAGAEQFCRVFKYVGYDLLLCLTATLERNDGKEKIISDLAPVFDTIGIAEARRSGWVADHYQYALKVKMDSQARKQYDECTKTIDSLFTYFNHDYQSSRDCLSLWGARNYVRDNNFAGDPGSTLEQKAKEYQGMAGNLARNFQLRRELVYNDQSKINAAAMLVEALQMKTVTFSETIACAENVAKKLVLKKVSAAPYYSGMVYAPELDGPKKLSKKKVAEGRMCAFVGGSFQVLTTAKALNEGMDVPGIQLGVIVSGTGTERTQKQRMGRVIRKENDKVSIIVNIVLADTVDERWLESRSGNMGVRRFSDFGLMIEDIQEKTGNLTNTP